MIQQKINYNEKNMFVDDLPIPAKQRMLLMAEPA